ncbi:unnamed protein product [Lymnaea stagnalis]|uniref:Uncharacterized protein n=1 Tax=Lymnaea stagnalis TaxID=6523 RepID=A0AAV2HZG8_LYMST
MLTVYMVDCSYVSPNVSVQTNVSVNTNVSYNKYTTYALIEKTSCPPIVKPLQLKDISNIVMLIIGGCMTTALLLNFACYCKYRKRRDSETPEELSQSSSQETPKNSPKKEGSTVSVQSTRSQTTQAKTAKTVKSPKGVTTLFTKYKESNADSSAYSVTL